MKNTRRGHHGGVAPRRGFSLVELVACTAILGILGSATASLMVHASEAYRGAVADARLCGDLSIALDRVHAVVRDAPSAAGVPDVLAVSPTLLRFGGTTLTLTAGALTLTEGASPPATLLTGVESLTFSAFDASGTALPADLAGAAALAVRRVGIEITASRDGRRQTLRTLAFIRSAAVVTP